MGSFYNKSVNKIRHYVLADSLSRLDMHLVLDQWFKHTLCVIYFTETILVLFGNGPVIKILFYGLAILIGLFKRHCVMNQWIKPDTMC